MSVVTLILLTIFFTILAATYNNNERMSMEMLHQAINIKTPFPDSPDRPNVFLPAETQSRIPASIRQPVLVVEISQKAFTEEFSDDYVSVITNQLHFIESEDITPIARLVLADGSESGMLRNYNLRYLKREQNGGIRIALSDISLEREMLKTQITGSLLIGTVSLPVLFFLSVLLAHIAVHPMETAWEKQKQFIADASHELKTPLTVILSNADILQKTGFCGDEKNALRVEHIHAEANRMKLLVNDMLTLAKSDCSENPAEKSVLDFSFIVNSALLMYEPVLYDEKKKLSYEIEDGLAVKGDGAQLQQIVHILLDNAQKYSPESGCVRVTLKKTERNALLLKVSNSGALIPKSELENIFLRFYRRDKARSEHGSFGLGLSIAQSIAAAHKGKIWAESETENTFHLTLPL